MSGAPRVKNRAPAPVQITAEQLLREAQERQDPKFVAQENSVRLEDHEELQEFQARKRKEFEEAVRRTKINITAWVKYAVWEASQGQMARARSVFERALDVDPHHIPLWLRYIDTELQFRNVQHARNLHDRAVSILPRVDQLWYKYVHLEELLGNIPGTRQVFERWMAWEPDEKAWAAYIAMETRYHELDRASAVWERAVTCHPEPRMWIKWAKFEEDRNHTDKARQVFQMALDFFGDDDEDKLEKAQTVYTAFAKMETRLKEYDRARMIYKFALERLPRSKSSGIYASYTRFEKQFGDRQGVEDTVLGKRRIQYEEELTFSESAGSNYDTWFDYTRLEEHAFRALIRSGASLTSPEAIAARNRVREIYERAVSNVPPSTVEKRHWRRYIFLWISYALFEEIDTADYARAREVYKAALALVPHKSFTFAKLWLNAAHFEIRRLDLVAARKLLGTAIGMCPKDRLFRGYVELELSLKEFDRARKIYEKQIEWDATSARTWVRFAELERNLFDNERARGVYELGIRQSELDMPELVWKSYIDSEFEDRNWDAVNALYERLLAKSAHVKVWISYANAQIGAAVAEEEFEDAPEDEDEEEEEERAQRPPRELTEEEQVYRARRRELAIEATRKIFNRAYDDLKMKGLKEERVVLLEAWKKFEREYATPEGLAGVEARMPRVVKRRRPIAGAGGEGMEEYYDMLFPDDDEGSGKPSFKLLQIAHAWRAAGGKGSDEEDEDEDDDDEDDEDEDAGARRAAELE
ncbi:NineTeen Complex (NTC) component [Tilletia horrida]|uniref:NineTeen Complex (NTC) component n=1 Tax=Tilletia horrida TaxID=155126 RepID=A0AAN6GSS5_9BASI|nr:NineTeen Complex (NTC) component [Tilletia horrida]KAK0551925.1 NineTeen Complex (NTC) component [Tilletia horrida]KAK0568656.1 NineTeen Complex (NTC) component [Tilletia horrida]